MQIKYALPSLKFQLLMGELCSFSYIASCRIEVADGPDTRRRPFGGSHLSRLQMCRHSGMRCNRDGTSSPTHIHLLRLASVHPQGFS